MPTLDDIEAFIGVATQKREGLDFENYLKILTPRSVDYHSILMKKK